jgi:hypothetical protein
MSFADEKTTPHGLKPLLGLAKNSSRVSRLSFLVSKFFCLRRRESLGL